MTSDAKIGLLLGLVFIFIIAFVINGLPTLNSDKNNNELTTTMVNSYDSPPALGAKERKVSLEVINAFEPPRTRPLPVVDNSPPKAQEIRFTVPLPSVAAIEPEPVLQMPPPADRTIAAAAAQAAAQKRPQFYVVDEGDSIADIAKKFYGPQDGNKKASIAAIFHANRQVLKSPDKIYPGQKLLVPELNTTSNNKTTVEGIFSAEIFEKAKSIGARPLSAGLTQKPQHKIYAVREYDTLWQIAVEQLGNGARYTEIVELNADIIDDEDALAVGMRLKMPTR